MRPLRSALVCAVAALTGCTSPIVLEATGPNRDLPKGLFAAFANAYDTGMQSRRAEDALQILDTGFALVDVNCEDFFRSEGQLQTTLNVIRDATALVGSIAAGALAALHTSQDAAAIVSLTVAGVSGGITVSNANFLFGTDNIDAVRELTQKALASHSDTVIAYARSNPNEVTVTWALKQVAQHQSLCRPAHILSITRSAIRNGTVTAYDQGTGGAVGVVDVPATVIDAFRTTLAANLGVGDLTEQQAAALYWFVSANATADRYPFLAAQLKALADKSPFDSSNRLKSGWPRSAVRDVFRAADVRVRIWLRQIVTGWMASASGSGAPAASAPGLTLAPRMSGPLPPAPPPVAAAPPPVAAGPSDAIPPRLPSALPSSIGVRVVPR